MVDSMRVGIPDRFVAHVRIPFLGIILAVFLILAVPDCRAEQQDHLFTTGPVQELDRCAAIWLIKRYVDPAAAFEIHPENDLVLKGTPFDTPVAELRRTHKMSTFEVIAEKFKVNDTKVEHIGRLIHEREINFLAKTRTRESLELERDIQELIDKSTNDEMAIGACLRFFDEYL